MAFVKTLAYSSLEKCKHYCNFVALMLNSVLSKDEILQVHKPYDVIKEGYLLLINS